MHCAHACKCSQCQDFEAQKGFPVVIQYTTGQDASIERKLQEQAASYERSALGYLTSPYQSEPASNQSLVISEAVLRISLSVHRNAELLLTIPTN